VTHYKGEKVISGAIVASIVFLLAVLPSSIIVLSISMISLAYGWWFTNGEDLVWMIGMLFILLFYFSKD